MPRAIKELSKLEIGRIRSNLSRDVSKLGERLKKFAMNEPINTAHGPQVPEMTSAQVNAAKIVLSHVLPSMQSTEITEHVERVTKEQVEGNLQAEIERVLHGMSKEDRQALIESVEARKQ